MGRKVKVIDSASIVIQQALENYPDLFLPKEDPKQIIAFTEISPASDQVASRWLGRRVKGIKANLQA